MEPNFYIQNIYLNKVILKCPHMNWWIYNNDVHFCNLNHWKKSSTSKILTSLLMLKIWNVFSILLTDNHKDCAASLGLHDVVDLVACCHCWCCHAFFRHSVVWLAEVSAVVGDLCSVLVVALWLCTTLHFCDLCWRVAAYCLEGDVYHCNVLHEELQTVAIVVR